MLTTRNAKSATQFCGSAIVSVPTGGRKKKFRQKVATTEAPAATARSPVAAIHKTTKQVAERNGRVIRHSGGAEQKRGRRERPDTQDREEDLPAHR